MQNPALVAADAILVFHFSIAVFIVLGLVSILFGYLCHWQWMRNPWFRMVHVAAIVFVAFQSWLGEICPLTRWEMALRSQGGDGTYSGTFVSYWLHRLLYFQAPEWVFVAAYSIFMLLSLMCWFWIPPRPFSSCREKS